jgi:hypothetical protein
MPEIIPEDGAVQETVTRRRIISAQKAAPAPPFWEYVSNLKDDDWSTAGGTPLHSLYVYRDAPPPRICVAKCTTAIFPGTNTRWSDQEEMELAFSQLYGGGNYSLILKHGSERVCVGHMTVPGPYKNLMSRADAQPNPYPQNGPQQGWGNGNGYQQQGNGNYYDPTAQVAETAIHHMANHDRTVMDVATSALAKAADVVKSFQPAPVQSASDELQKAFMSAMISRLTAPQPDPIETFARMAALLRDANPGSSGGIAGSVMDKVIGQIVDRGLNPPITGSGPVSMGAELVRILPNVAQYVCEGMQNYARIIEAQRDAMAMQTARPAYLMPASSAAPARPIPMTPPPSAPAPAPAHSSSNGTAGGQDIMSFIEQKIIEILAEPQSAEWAAEETLSFLDRMDPSIVPQLTSGGESGLNSLFQTRAILKPAFERNSARVQEFIRSFLRYAAESSRSAPKPN